MRYHLLRFYAVIARGVKDVLSHGMSVQCGHFSDGGSSDADVGTYCCKKLRIL